MTQHENPALVALAAALDRFDQRLAGQVCDRIIVDLRAGNVGLSDVEAVGILRLLQAKRCFSLVQRVADAMIHGGFDQAAVRRHYAQALIDQEMPTAGLSILRGLVDDPVTGSEQRAEAYGLIGRAYKQLYVSAGGDAARRRDHLNRAVEAYHSVFTAEPTRLWHGINTVGLLLRAVRDGVDLRGHDNPAAYASDLARHIVDTIEADPDPQRWEFATALEACVALDRIEEAQGWLRRYVNAAQADAFEFASTLRQLVEVWNLDDVTEPGARLLPLLRATLLRCEGGAVSVPASQLERRGPRDDRELERVFGTAGFQTLRWFRDALDRCRLVARIEDGCGDGVGTGLLVEGGLLHESLPETVLLTNAHVIPEAIAVQDAYVTLRGRETAEVRYRVDSLLWTSPRDNLDVSIVTLQTLPDSVGRCPVAPALPPLDTQPSPRVFIIGHPNGRAQPMFSIQDNLMLDHDTTKVHYVAATEPGSSGSPAFDDQWRLIAIHHSGSAEMPRLHGGGTYQANEGIWVGAIRQAISQDRAGG